MSDVRFLVFRGSLQNEGNFWALETDNSIVIVCTGKDNPSVTKNTLSADYLVENKSKIKAIFLSNSSPKNSGCIQTLYNELGIPVPIYGSSITKVALESYYYCSSDTLSNFVEVNSIKKEVQVGDFFVNFFLLDSYLLGNVGLSFSYNDSIFYYLEDFSFNVLNSNASLFQSHFFQKFRKFLSIRKKKTYLITGCQNLKWNNNGSLSLESKRFVIKDKDAFLIFYDFDFLHIIEALEIAQRFNRRVNILDERMHNFLQRALSRSPLLRVINKFNSNKDEKRDCINILTLNIDDMEKKVLSYFKGVENCLFVSCLFPMSGGEERLARVHDILHAHHNEIIDLGRSENLSIGTNFYDLKFILKNLNPNLVVLLQNSYKHDKYFANLKLFKTIIVPNNHYLNFSSRKIGQIKNSKQFLNTESLLFFQREKLLKNGLFVVFLSSFWEQGKLKISTIKVNSLSVSTTIDMGKLEKKIKQWWETKITSESDFFARDPNVKQHIERRLSGLIKNYLSFENDVEMDDPLFLIFIRNERSN